MSCCDKPDLTSHKEYGEFCKSCYAIINSINFQEPVDIVSYSSISTSKEIKELTLNSPHLITDDFYMKVKINRVFMFLKSMFKQQSPRKNFFLRSKILACICDHYSLNVQMKPYESKSRSFKKSQSPETRRSRYMAAWILNKLKDVKFDSFDEFKYSESKGFVVSKDTTPLAGNRILLYTDHPDKTLFWHDLITKS